MDPLALRLKNYTGRDAAKDLPCSSKELRACYAQAAVCNAIYHASASAARR
jgi:xanthine dehydrogenase YagR molybdenum-binding subunit